MAWTLSRRVWFLVGLAIFLAIFLLYWNARRPAPRVTVIQIQRGSLSSTISSNGKIEPVAPYALRAKFDGFVERVTSTEGQSVRASQLLLTLNDTEIRSELDQARAQLNTEEDDLHSAQAGGRADQAAHVAGDLRAAESQQNLLQRQQESLAALFAEKAATADEVARNRTALERANADVDQLRKAKQEFTHQVSEDLDRLALLVEHSQAQINDLQDKVASARVAAPASGTLFSLPVHAGDFVHTGDLLADIADLRQVRVRAYIDEPELGKLQLNQAVEVTWDALPDRTWTGRTENVPKQVVARGARNVGEILCSVSNERLELIPNTTVDVRIQISEHANVLTVPRGAVQIVGIHRYVFLLDGNHLRRTEIKVGISDAEQFEVLAGVPEGAYVALPGDYPLKANMAVRPVYPE